jgi:hypothetical protein
MSSALSTKSESGTYSASTTRGSTPASTSTSVSSVSARTAQLDEFLDNFIESRAYEKTPSGAARSLIAALDKMGFLDVSYTFRKQILNQMRDNAVKDFFEAWAHNPVGMEGLRIWLKDASNTDGLSSKKKRELEETMMPLLNVCCHDWLIYSKNPKNLKPQFSYQVIDRLPLALDDLLPKKGESSKITLPRLVKRIVKNPPSNGEFLDHPHT